MRKATQIASNIVRGYVRPLSALSISLGVEGMVRSPRNCTFVNRLLPAKDNRLAVYAEGLHTAQGENRLSF